MESRSPLLVLLTYLNIIIMNMAMIMTIIMNTITTMESGFLCLCANLASDLCTPLSVLRPPVGTGPHLDKAKFKEEHLKTHFVFVFYLID